MTEYKHIRRGDYRRRVTNIENAMSIILYVGVLSIVGIVLNLLGGL